MRHLLIASSFALLAMTATEAAAVSERVKKACRDDYRANCSAFDVGTDGSRACMRAIRHKLSKTCVSALADSDEVTDEDIRRYKRETAGR